MKVTIQNLRGENERITLPPALYERDMCGRSESTTGVWYTGLYCGPRTGRMILRAYSIWENPRTHGVTGEYYEEVDLSTFLALCDQLNVAVPDQISAPAL